MANTEIGKRRGARRLGRAVLVLLGGLVLLLGGLGVWYWLQPPGKHKPLEALTPDTALLLVMNQPQEAWSQLTGSPLWAHLRQHPQLQPYQAVLSQAEHETFGMQTLLESVGALRLVAALHAPEAAPADWSLVVDIGKKSAVLGSMNLLEGALASGGLEAIPLGRGDTALRRVTGEALGDTLYLLLHENLLLVGPTDTRVRLLRNQLQTPYLSGNPAFERVQSYINTAAPLNLYVQHSRLNYWLLGPGAELDAPQEPDSLTAELARLDTAQMAEQELLEAAEQAGQGSPGSQQAAPSATPNSPAEPDCTAVADQADPQAVEQAILQGLEQAEQAADSPDARAQDARFDLRTLNALHFSSADLEFHHEWISLKGLTTLARGQDKSLLGALVQTGKAPVRGPDILPGNTAAYLGLQFADFEAFFDRLEAAIQQEPSMAADYAEAVRMLEGYFKFSLREHFVSWVGDELSIGVLPPDPDRPNTEEQLLLAFHTRDLAAAQAGLEHMLKRVKRRSPLRIKQQNYRGYPIQRFVISGFFRLLLGKLVEGVELPYYTYLGQHVVFCPSVEGLHRIIEAYERNDFLAGHSDWQLMQSRMVRESNLVVYWNAQAGFPLLQAWVDLPVWMQIQEHAAYVLAPSPVMLQGVSARDALQTELRMRYAQPANSTINQQMVLAGRLQQARIGDQPQNGPYKEYYKNGELRTWAFFREGKLNGQYRAYYRNGQLKEQGRYAEGDKVGRWYYYNRRGKLKDEVDHQPAL